MKRTSVVTLFIALFLTQSYGAWAGVLDDSLKLVRNACGGISNKMQNLKTKAGINTALTAVGTATGAVALGTGIAKAKTDKTYEELLAEIADDLAYFDKMAATQKAEDIDVIPEIHPEDIADVLAEMSVQATELEQKQAELERLEKKSKTLGNVRTGTMAGTAVTDTAGAIIAATNRVNTDLMDDINACIESVRNLSRVAIQVEMDGSADKQEIAKARNIVENCGAWEGVDLSKINKRATGAAISAGVGGATAMAGTVTSALANSNSVRENDTDEGKQKEKNLNLASNILAGGATAASVTATVFNATQIAAIKKAASVADNCEGALQ